MKTFHLLWQFGVALLLPVLAHAQAHVHFDAGAMHSGPGVSLQGDPLGMINGTANFAPYVFALTLTSTPTLSGFAWETEALTFTALKQSPDTPSAYGTNDRGATSGSFLELQIVSVTSDSPGGIFAFYDTNLAEDPGGSTRPGQIIQILSGTAGATAMFNLTDPDWFVVGNTFGHVHGRVWSVDQAGTYDVSFILKDTSGGVTHPDSAPFTVRFHAAPEPGAASLLVLTSGFLLTRRQRRASPAHLRQTLSLQPNGR